MGIMYQEMNVCYVIAILCVYTGPPVSGSWFLAAYNFEVLVATNCYVAMTMHHDTGQLHTPFNIYASNTMHLGPSAFDRVNDVDTFTSVCNLQ